MSNVLAIAQKELRGYFVSPIAYVVIGFFALLFGYFYIVGLYWFAGQSMQSGMMGGGGPVNINQQMIGPVLQNAAVIILFFVPLMTMRTYAEEKRSGTIELLLTSPVSDVQIILGKFLGALGLYAAMLGVTIVYIALLWIGSRPEFWPIVTGYLGLLLLGASFIALGLLISSLTKNQIVAGVITFALVLMFWVVGWMANFLSGTTGDVLNYVSLTSHTDDFMKGVIDTKNIIYYLSFITFGLFLTAKAVDTERWRG